MTTSATLSQPARARGVWVKDSLPDSDLTVLVRTNDPEFAVWPGFHDGEGWRMADASTAVGLVLGWMNLEDAAKHLDSITL
mgnify:CR=1 FL=1|jgi:hypothetical protein